MASRTGSKRPISSITAHSEEVVTVYTTEDPSSGKVYAFWANFGNGLSLDIVESTSTDGGQTWSEPKAIDSLTQGVNAIVNCGGVKQGVIQFIPGDTALVALNFSLPQASVDPVTHHVYVVDSEKVGKNVNVVLLSSEIGSGDYPMLDGGL